MLLFSLFKYSFVQIITIGYLSVGEESYENFVLATMFCSIFSRSAERKLFFSQANTHSKSLIIFYLIRFAFKTYFMRGFMLLIASFLSFNLKGLLIVYEGLLIK